MKHGIRSPMPTVRPGSPTFIRALFNSRQEGRYAVLACSALSRAIATRWPPDSTSASSICAVLTTDAQAHSRRHGHFAGESILAGQFADLEEPRDAITIAVEGTPEEIATAPSKIAALISACSRKSSSPKLPSNFVLNECSTFAAARSGPLPASGNSMSNEVSSGLIQNSQNRSIATFRWLTLAAALVALGLFYSNQVRAQDPEERQDQPAPPPAQSQQPPTQQPDVQPARRRKTLPIRVPVTSRDTFPQEQDPNAVPTPNRHAHDRPPSAANAPTNAPVPQT
jgi:hypothetical protein